MNTNSYDIADTSAASDNLGKLEQALAAGLAPITPQPQQESALRARLLARAARSRESHRGLITLRTDDGEWKDIKAGVRAKILYDNGKTRSALIEFSPGTSMPTHRHQAHEECVVLRGSLQLGDLNVGQHDFHVAPAGSRHGRIQSNEGALIYLRGTSLGRGAQMARELLTAWLPGRGVAPRTVFADQPGWEACGPGVEKKQLWSADGTESALMRLAPGASMAAHPHSHDEECMMVAGEAFFGDILLRSGEYQLAPGGTQHGDIYSDVGALLFMNRPAA